MKSTASLQKFLSKAIDLLTKAMKSLQETPKKNTVSKKIRKKNPNK